MCNKRQLLITSRKSYTGCRLAPNSMTLDDLERKNRGFYGFFSQYRAAQVYIIHKEAPPSPTPHAPMADVYHGPDGPTPSDMRFSKL